MLFIKNEVFFFDNIERLGLVKIWVIELLLIVWINVLMFFVLNLFKLLGLKNWNEFEKFLIVF